MAAAYANEDACVDHADEGVWGEMFLAALESAAFAENDPDKMLDVALHLIPSTSRVRQAVEDTYVWWKRFRDWKFIRDQVLSRHGNENCTDAPMNIAFTVLGWLAGDGDFSRAICTAVNCGKDTDCTGATVGALMGIIDPKGIPERWLEPIGRRLVLSPEIVGLDAPKTLDELTALVLSLRERLDERPPSPRTYQQTTDGLQICAEASFVRDLPAPGEAPASTSTKPLSFAGTVGTMPRNEFRDEVAVVRYNFRVPGSGLVRVMFNTREECRVWIDGKFAFQRGSGSMGPSLHRHWENHGANLPLTAGGHELVAAFRIPPIGRDAEWVVGIGDAKTYEWFPKAFLVKD
jgi:hypothetical protein